MNRTYDIVVVGAGPAGLAAATAASNAGHRVAVVDDNPHAGGQIWRAGAGRSAADRAKEQAIAAFEGSGAHLFAGHQVVDAAPSPGTLQAWVGAEQRLESFAFESLILATGARERFLPFPGWTLPGVFGAGGLQALVRGGYDIRGKRVVVAGTGPLLLAVAAHLKQDGAEIVTIAEQAPMRRLAGFATNLISRPAKVLQGMRLRTELGSVPYRTGCWVVAVEGGETVTAVRLTDGSRTWTERCDLLACGFHLVPNTELASLLECQMTETGVEVNAEQQTSVKGIYCAGEPTGVAGVDAATVQGKIAGLVAAGKSAAATQLYARRDAEAAFGRAMTLAFALRPELLSLAAPDTIVCRCEDVRLGDLQGKMMPRKDWTDAKLQTRCGMGPCQGRICGPALEALFGWRNASVRPPVFPVPISALCSAPSDDEVSILEPQEISR
jgi:NADPH-dependent 2,4-dienoyl-CoA reductase/sulfur reductase-like enzyme